jgi:cation diffusion facilitator CzcD-associated flavoprotein CzcO
MENRTKVAIIGAGFAGMYLLHRLRGMGVPAKVLEAGSGVGGTWYWNRYPGARCDIESIQYSYQFDDELQQEWDWAERYATQPEILRYAEHIADRYDLRRDIQFNTRISAATYDEAASEWTLEAEDGAKTTAQMCVMATGCLSVPNKPNLKGLENFAGPVYHTGEWPHEPVDFTSKRVAIIGTGSSAIQSIPRIAEQAAHLTVFQRTANYSVPAGNTALNPEYVESIKARYAEFRAEASKTGPGIHAVFNPNSVLDATPEQQYQAYEERWQKGGLIFMGAFGDAMLSEEANAVPANFVRDKIRKAVKNPAVADRLTPKNIIGAKRLCVDTGYYDTFNRDNVSLIDIKETPLQEITANAVNVEGKEVEIDALVIATGFDAMTGAIKNVDIRGRGDARLQDRWADGPSSYLGLAMADFPNLFTVTGPGSPSVFTNMLPTIEQHVEWIADCIGYMNTGNYRCIEATEEAEKAWWEHVQEVASVGIKWTADSWYIGANVEGKPRVFMPYLGGYPEYCRRCDEIVADGYRGFAFS